MIKMPKLQFRYINYNLSLIRSLFILLLIFKCLLLHAQPQTDATGFWKHLSRSVTKGVCRNTLLITKYLSITGKQDSLIFHHAKGQDVLIFQWQSENYQALLTPTGQDSSFILRYNHDEHYWQWACKSRFEFPTAYHWNLIPGDSTSYVLFADSPRNGYERLLLLTFIGYTMRNEGIHIPLYSTKNKRKPWGSFFSMIGKGQKKWYFNSERFGRQKMEVRLMGRIKRHVSSGEAAVGEMTVYKRR